MATQKQQAKAAYERWKTSPMHSLDDAYKSYSEYKLDAWRYCKGLCAKYNGTGLKIISANGFVFSAGFTFSDPDDGTAKFMYITKTHDTIIDI